MTNDPASIERVLRTFAIYAVCAILAIVLGVLMTNPMTYSSLGFIAVLCSVMALPLLLRWHHPLMVLAWNAPIMMFFIKGDPKLFLVMITISLSISVVERTLNQRRFIQVPQVAAPLIFLIGVVLVTAKLTGGIGLKAFGSDVYGGKKYVFLIVAILGYFALTAVPIPPQKARQYVVFFFLGGVLSFIGDFYPIAPGFLKPIFYFFPPSIYYSPNGIELGVTRLAGTSWAGTAVVSVIIACYGLRGIFLSGRLWRPVVFFLALVLIFFGGFRSALIMTGALIMLQFFLEGLHRTQLMPFFVLVCLGAMVALIPLGSKLPQTFQRTLAFVPEGLVHLSADARLDAQASTDWRLDMWKALLPQIPKHLLLGKGYAISMEDFAAIAVGSTFQSSDPGQQALALSNDYHNGPLSVVLPFGIWGVIGFVWFLLAGLRVLYFNFRYGDPVLHVTNTFLFANYVLACINFFGGAFDTAMAGFTGLVGLSVCINHGVCRPPVRPAVNIPFNILFANSRLKTQARMSLRKK